MEAGGLQVRCGFHEPEQPGAVGAFGGGGEVAPGDATEAANPESDGEIEVGLERFDGDELESGGFGSFDFAGERLKGELAAEGNDFGRVMPGGAGNAIDNEEAFWNEHGGNGGEVLGEVGRGNLLEERDVGDLVEDLGAEGRRTQVTGGGRTAAGERHGFPAGAGRGEDALAGGIGLNFAGGDAESIGLPCLDGAQGESAPSAGHVKEAITGLDAERAANAVQGNQLRAGELRRSKAGGFRIGAGARFGIGVARAEGSTCVAEEGSEPGFKEADGQVQRAGGGAPVGRGGFAGRAEAA